MQTLADKLRPKTIDEMVGQAHLLGKNKVLRNMIENKNTPNMILFGPPGVGKTTLADIMAKNTDKKLYKLNATTASVKDIQNIASELNTLIGYKGVILYLDEIHAFSKQRQNSILSYLESGQITLIASTTENPYHTINSALLSRCMIFEFKPITTEEVVKRLEGCVEIINSQGVQILKLEDNVLNFIANISKGDLRKSISILEIIMNSSPIGEVEVTIDKVQDLFQETLVMDESKYYDWVSMLQKSIRGSDVDASLLALAALLKAGKMEETIRRLLVIASEDCGMAFGNMYSTFFSLISAAKMVGMPEARIILSHAVILLATSPKSNSAVEAIDRAMHDLETKDIGEIQMHLRDCHYQGAKKLGVVGYKYPHDYPNNWVDQEYMTTNLVGKTYYTPGNNKYEISLKQYWDNIKKKK